MGICRLLAAFMALVSAASAQPLVVETDPLSPAEQRAKFHLPPGFEIQLVVGEPDIGQPMNMNFDARGRLWVTSSLEYPYPVAGEGVEPREERWGKPENRPGRDRITILEGIDDTGKPAAIQRFADNLNIPIGIIPDGDGAIVYSIPNIERLRDTDGDGRADERTRLYGPFGNVDTHGMVNSFTRGADGWIYACHGFRNTSRVQGADGHVIEMNSGNTFRFRPDGSRLEHWTHGQVNPFGLCFDPWGNLYSADCHSRPLTCLLRGAYYQSFGKPHDGLGFAPDMIDHNHGSTGICGCAWYDADQFPAEYRGCIFLCNPVTGRVHRDRIDFRGSSPWAVMQAEFITCDDGWFRPVDVKLGPDGALYIADFYNSIIGHYEAPLDHPRRDRSHGRIWRVVYRGEAPAESRPSGTTQARAASHAATSPAQFDISQASLSELVERLGDANLMVRHLVLHELLSRFPLETACRAVADQAFPADRQAGPEVQRAQAVWVVSRSGQLQGNLGERIALDPSPLVRTQLFRALAEEPIWTDVQFAAAAAREHLSPHATRAWIDAVGRHPEAGFNLFAVDAPSSADPGIGPLESNDRQARQALKIARRNLLVSEANRKSAMLHPEQWIDIALGSPTPAAAQLLLAVLDHSVDRHQRGNALQHIARYGNTAQLDELLQTLRTGTAANWRDEWNDLQSARRGLLERGGSDMARLRPLGERLATRLLSEPLPGVIGWTPVAHGPNARPDSAFGTQTRPFADGQQGALLHSSFPKGEQRTGLLRSDAFELPARLSFFIAGHNGPPNQPVTPRNLVRLCDASTGEVLREVLPPRNDTAQRVEWDLTDLSRRRGVIEIVDGDDRSAYAWLAVGRFSIEGLNPAVELPHTAACELVADLELAELEPQLATLLCNNTMPDSLRSAAAGALLKLHPNARCNVLREAAGLASVSPALREACFAAIARSAADGDAAEVATLLKQVVQAAPAEAQRQLAALLAGDRDGAAALLDLIQEGAASPRLLQEALLVERLRTWNLADFETRLASLTADLPDVAAALTELLNARREQFRTATAVQDDARGRAVFKQHCAACHQLDGEGAKVGPQLDGIGLRGPDRLLEDILDPNRNVDAAFRSTTLVLTSGQVVSGLLRRDEGATLVLADQQGKEFSVSREDIELSRASALSLMPEKLGEAIPPDDLVQLVRYLLKSRAAASER